MALGIIKYKDFQFPNNPETTEFKCDRSYIQHKYPGKAGNELEDFGVDAIVVTGTGYLFGKNAYSDFRKLYAQYKKGGVGSFYHPIFTNVTRGLMTSLNGTVEPGGKAVRYTFEIVADTVPDVKENKGKYKKKEEPKKQQKQQKQQKKSYKVGDKVYFKGGTHYVSSWSGSAGYPARAGYAKITLGPNCKGNGGAHPYHLIHTDSKSNVYGWVNKGTFK